MWIEEEHMWIEEEEERSLARLFRHAPQRPYTALRRLWIGR
jgi:hypothetical protein